MKVFYKEGDWSNKVNFVDDNNVLLGYSNEDDCCAHGGWFLADNSTDWLEEEFKEESMDLPGWNFDKEYFKDGALKKESEFTEGNAVQFRLVNGDKEKFLTLYNFHNGYYARGFEFKEKETVLKEGSV